MTSFVAFVDYVKTTYEVVVIVNFIQRFSSQRIPKNKYIVQ